MVYRQRRGLAFHVGELRERDHRVVLGADVNILEIEGIALIFGIDFEHDVILIELGEDGGDLALAIGIVEGVVEILGGDAET